MPPNEQAKARFVLGSQLQQQRRLDEAEAVFRDLLAMAPGHVPGHLGLGGVLIEAKRPAEAEAVLRAGLAMPAVPMLEAMLHTNLGLALRHQRRDVEALAEYDRAMALAPTLPGLDIHRAEALQNLKRYDEALAVYRSALAARPQDAEVHRLTNDLLYRLKSDDYLKSYDRAPPHRALMLGKARFLAEEKRGADCLSIYRELLSVDANDDRAALGAAEALSLLNRHQEALSTYDTLLARHGGDAPLFGRAAQAALLAGDPERAPRRMHRLPVDVPLPRGDVDALHRRLGAHGERVRLGVRVLALARGRDARHDEGGETEGEGTLDRHARRP